MTALTSPSPRVPLETRGFRASFLAMLGVTLVYMLTALNGSAVSTALPRMAAELQGFTLYSWPASAYLLTSIVAIPVVGRLGDLQGRKRLLLWAIGLFGLTSAGCAAAQSMEQLVIARALQGVGGGMVAGVLSACIADLFPQPVDRMRWQLMHSVGFALAQGAGPWLGGWATEHASWRLVFLANVPLALLAGVTIWRFFPMAVHHDGPARHVDSASVAMLAASLTSLVVWSHLVETAGGSSPQALGCIAVALGAAIGFVRRQPRLAAPVVPPEVVASRGPMLLLLLSVLTGLILSVLSFTTPLLLRASFQMSADRAGAVMTPLLLGITAASVVNARISMRMLRAESLMWGGQLLLTAGCLLLVFVDQGTSAAFIAVGLGVCGAGLGFLLPNFTQHILTLVSPQNGGVASALGQASRLMGGLFGAALGWALVACIFKTRVETALASWPLISDLAPLLSSPQVLLPAGRSAQAQAGGPGRGCQPRGRGLHPQEWPDRGRSGKLCRLRRAGPRGRRHQRAIAAFPCSPSPGRAIDPHPR